MNQNAKTKRQNMEAFVAHTVVGFLIMHWIGSLVYFHACQQPYLTSNQTLSEESVTWAICNFLSR